MQRQKRKRSPTSSMAGNPRLRLKSDGDEKTKGDFFQPPPPPSSSQQQPIESRVDYISNLPSPLLASILAFLPIKQAARTSVLSRQWRHLWLSLPCFNIDESIGFSFQTFNWPLTISHIVDQHEQTNDFPISCFNIILPLGGAGRFEQLLLSGILVARHRGIRRLMLCNTLSPAAAACFAAPREFFECFALEDFFVKGCVIEDLPNPMRISPCLRSLELVDVFISDEDFRVLMTCSSASLQQLCLEDVRGLESLVLPLVPKLSALKVFDDKPLRRISLAGARQLSVLALDLWSLMLDDEGEEAPSLVDVLMDVSGVQRLCLQFLQDSTEDQVEVDMRKVRLPQCLPFDNLLINLRELEMKLSLADASLVQILLSLLCISPNLEALVIEDDEFGIVSSEEIIDIIYWEKQHIPRCLKNTLSSVQLQNVDLKCQSVVGFVNFILINSRVLKTVSINNKTVLP